MHVFEVILQKKSQRWGRYFTERSCPSAIRLHTWTVSRDGDSLLVSLLLLTLFPKTCFDTIFYIKSKTRTQHNLTWGTVQSKLTWAVLSKWFFLMNMALFFFIVVNYLWTDCDHTNKLDYYSRRFSILKQYFMLRPLANLLFRLIIHTTTGISPVCYLSTT